MFYTRAKGLFSNLEGGAVKRGVFQTGALIPRPEVPPDGRPLAAFFCGREGPGGERGEVANSGAEGGGRANPRGGGGQGGPIFGPRSRIVGGTVRVGFLWGCPSAPRAVVFRARVSSRPPA